MPRAILNPPSNPGIIATKPIKPLFKPAAKPAAARPFVVNRPPSFFSPLEAVSDDRSLKTRLVIINSPSARGFNNQNEKGQTALAVCLQNDHIALGEKGEIIAALLKRGAKISANKNPSEVVDLATKQDPNLGNLLGEILKSEKESPKTAPKAKSATNVSPPKMGIRHSSS